MFAAERASWQNPRVLTTLVLVFLTGAMAGAITMRARACTMSMPMKKLPRTGATEGTDSPPVIG